MDSLTPAVQAYDWGTTDDLPRLLRTDPTGSPLAEAWWGAHPAGPTRVVDESGETTLAERIAADPVAALGPEIARAFGGRLPFLLKVLAIAKPLSLQVHPTTDDARAGFDAEEAAGVPLDAASRVYRDRNPKPEMIVALTPMVVLAGFRPAASVRRDLERAGHPDAAPLLEALRAESQPAALATYVRLALGLPDAADLVDAVARTGREPDAGPSLRAAADAAAHFPGDPGVLVALAMHRVDLAPGEACFTPVGMVHSYQSGVGVEIMANSDNVVRAGLTSKHVDVDELLRVASTAPASPGAPETERSEGATMFWPRADEFLLSVLSEGTHEFIAHPRVVLVVDGRAVVASEAGGTRELIHGDAVFIPYSDGEVAVAAFGTVIVAGVPIPDKDRRLARTPVR